MVCYLLDEYPHCHVTCIDRLSYATKYLSKNLEMWCDLPRYNFKEMDLADGADETIFSECKDEEDVTILHFAAESCVDRSYVDPLFFTRNNIFAMQNVLEAYRKRVEGHPDRQKTHCMVHISTDEVYGEQKHTDTVTEDSLLFPSNPYSATKAACDLILHSYVKSFNDLRISIIRSNNVYGPGQYPEKLISKTLEALKHVDRDGFLSESWKVPIHGTGDCQRSYLHVRDFVAAVILIERNARDADAFGQIFNVGVKEEIKNRDLVYSICSMYMKLRFEKEQVSEQDFVTFVKDRYYNDARYSLDLEKIHSLGWAPRITFEEGISELVQSIIP